jgi:hypothetical protein
MADWAMALGDPIEIASAKTMDVIVLMLLSFRHVIYQ